MIKAYNLGVRYTLGMREPRKIYPHSKPEHHNPPPHATEKIIPPPSRIHNPKIKSSKIHGFHRLAPCGRRGGKGGGNDVLSLGGVGYDFCLGVCGGDYLFTGRGGMFSQYITLIRDEEIK